MKQPLISVIIPDDTQNLPLYLIDLDTHLSKQEISYEIIVVSKKEHNKTREVVTRLSHAIKNLELILQEPYDTERNPAEVGVTQARGTWTLFIDTTQKGVDLQEINKVITKLKKEDEATVVLSSRHKDGAYTQTKQGLGTRLLNALVTKKEKSPYLLALKKETALNYASTLSPEEAKISQKLLENARKNEEKTLSVPIFWK